MKKLFLLFATVTLLIGVQACKQKEAATDASTEVATDSTAAVVTTDSTAAAAAEDTSGGKGIKQGTDPVKTNP